MKRSSWLLTLCLSLALGSVAAAASPAPKERVFDTKPLGMRVSIKMIGPYGEPADLQIIPWLTEQLYGWLYGDSLT